jgi:hypothetical protein
MTFTGIRGKWTYEGKRVQRFVYKGMGTVVAGAQGVVWPGAR